MNVQVDGGVFEIHDFGEARLPMGTCYMDQKTDKEWVYVKAHEDLEQGEAVQSVGDISSLDNIAATAAGSNEIGAASGNFLTNNTNAIQNLGINFNERDYERLILYVKDDAGEGQIAHVRDIQSDVIKVTWLTSTDGKLKTALTTSSEINLAAPWLVKKGTAGEGVVGIVQFDVKKGNYFWVLRMGLGVGLVTVGASLTAVVINGELGVAGTSNGTMQANGNTDACAFSVGGLATSRSAALVPIQANASQRISVISPNERWT